MPRAEHPRPPAERTAAHDPGEEALPAVIGTWRRAYVVVMLDLALCVAAFWLLGRVFG